MAMHLITMFIVDCIPLSFIAKFMKGISIHGPIAAFLARESWTLEEVGALVKKDGLAG